MLAAPRGYSAHGLESPSFLRYLLLASRNRLIVGWAFLKLVWALSDKVNYMEAGTCGWRRLNGNPGHVDSLMSRDLGEFSVDN